MSHLKKWLHEHHEIPESDLIEELHFRVSSTQQVLVAEERVALVRLLDY